MLSPENTSVSEPLYVYYLVEDDLDTAVDDQPIDFSKRYSDLNSGCKTVGKKRHRSTTASVSSEPIGSKQPCEDDVRVYCIEGTPLLISSSSSMCDIRDCSSFEGGLRRKSLDLKDRFSLSENSKTSPDSSKEQDMVKENEESVVEENKNNEVDIEDTLQSFAAEEVSSELPSPLMFSRSSSVGSLNSSEQHSIIDDRSSVSIFSNLPSGIISPSELPDSPGEAMSPFIHKNRQQVFKFPPPEDDKQSVDHVPNLDKVCNDAYSDAPEDVLKVYDIEGDCSSMSSFSELSIHTSSHMSLTYSNDCVNIKQKTSIKMDCVTNGEPVQNSNFDGSVDIGDSSQTVPLPLEKPVHYNQSGESSYSTMGEKNYLQSECESPDKIVNSPMIEDMKDSLNNEEDGESDFSVIESDGEADALLEECIRSGKALKSMCDTEKYSCALEERNGLIRELESDFNGYEGEDKAEDLNSKRDKAVGDIVKLTNKNEKNLEGKNECKSEDSKLDFSMIESDCKAVHLTEKYLKDRKSIEDVHNIKGDKLLEEQKQYEETAEFCNSLNESDDEIDALLEECIRNGKPNAEKSEKVVKLQPNKIVNFNSNEVPQVSVVREPSVERKNSVPKFNFVQRSQKHSVSEKLKKTAKVYDSASSKVLKPKICNTSPNSKQKLEYYQGNTSTNAYQCCNAFQGRKCRLDQNQRSCHGMKPYRSENLPERASDPMKKLRKEILIGLYRTLHQKLSRKEEFYNRIEEDYEETENDILQQYIQLGMPTKSRRPCSQTKEIRGNSSYQRYDKNLGYRDNHRPDGISDGEDDDDIIMACINAGKPKRKTENKSMREQSSQNQTPIISPNKLVLQQQKRCINNNISLGSMHQSMSFAPPKSRWTSPIVVPDHGLVTPVEESPCVYKTEDTPVLSPTASMSDLSCLSFSEDKSTHSNLNNSRNSDISSDTDDDDDDELLLQCIQSGMPSAKKAIA
ncbi:putative leucine-rich repeat-containing protein DDB_G0290503 isoform X3 [Parasteatoda tepidariorum]|uniref:putative leucine-rich repeat-containing protein DDB_G0290503 isoform X3 n=1 Tax=Parasteatoda tepidariorum TaxID=114398 RepID=UPI0039BD0C0A